MSVAMLSGKVQTVLGLVDPDQLGRTMTHEHLTMTFDCCYSPPPPGDEAVAENPFQMQHMHWLRQNPYSCRENLLLQQETGAVQDELLAFRKAGGGTVVENTTAGIDRDLPALKRLSQNTGVHVIAGAGYYVDCTHTEATKRASVETVSPGPSVALGSRFGHNLACAAPAPIVWITRREERPAFNWPC